MGHFLGTVVVIGDKQPTGSDRHKVIDGQQRITTITLLARVLLEFVDGEHTDSGKKQSLSTKLVSCLYVDIAGNEEPRMRLNREDDFYQQSVVKCATKAEREAYWKTLETSRPVVRLRIVEALQFFYDEVERQLEAAGAAGTPARNQAIESLVYAVCDLFYVLKIRVKDQRMAYRLFETLNERGLDLSQADLVRNVVLEKAELLGQQPFDETLVSWQTLLEQVDSQQPELLSVPVIFPRKSGHPVRSLSD